MSLSRAPEIQQVTSILWIDANNTVDSTRQDGTIERPFSFVQQAIDHAVAAGTTSWNFQVAFGDYSAQTLTIPPNLNLVVEGRTKRGPNSALGPINWTVTGTNTSGITFRRIIVGALTIIDDAVPAGLARLAYLDCECKGITVTGTSIVNAAMGGETLASFDPSISDVVSSVVSGPIDLAGGTMLSENTQFKSTCTSIAAEAVFVGGSSVQQNFNISGTEVQFKSSIFAGAFSITFASPGSILFDESSSTSFIEQGWSKVNGSHYISTQRSTGWLSGGLVTRNSGLDVDVTSGTGYIFEGDDVVQYVTWTGTTVTLPANDLLDIFVDSSGVIQTGPHPINERTDIILSTASTDGSDVRSLSAERIESTQIVPQMSEYALKVAGSIHVTGLATTVYSPPSLQLTVDSGTYYNGIHFNSTPAMSPITFTYWYRDGSGGWTTVPGQSLIDTNFYDDSSGTLAALTSIHWKKDLLFVSRNDSGTEYHVIYAQQYYTSQAEAEAGNLPVAPDEVIQTSLRLYGIVTQGAATEITSNVDVRPRIGQLSSGSTAVTDHGLLSGLSDDDHLQYLLVNGSRPMSGNLNMGTNSITNVNLVDGVDVSAHASRHLPTGADPITTAAPTSNLNAASVNAVGTANALSRSDHGHKIDTGNLTEATSSVLTISGGTSSVIGTGTTVEVKQASGSQSGYLSATDWTTFNNKQNTHLSVRLVSSATVVTATDDVVRCNGTFTVSLPVATGGGKVYYIKNIGIGAITIAPNGSDKIDGKTSVVMFSRYSDTQLLDAAAGFWDIL